MANKRGKIVGFLLIVIVIIGGYLLTRYIPENVRSLLTYQNINLFTIIFYGQWIIVAIIVLYVFFAHIRKKSREKQKIASSGETIKKTHSQTDFDVLYRLLKEKKSLNTQTISEIFKIKRETALEWAKILESNDIATVEYPTFGNPEVIFRAEEEGSKKKGKQKKENHGKEGEKVEDKKTKEAKAVKKVPAIKRNMKPKSKKGKSKK